MNGPKASIDRCENCIYWERLERAKPERGVCHVITYPEKFQNDLAIIAPIVGMIGKFSQATGSLRPIFAPVPYFHCTLYKVAK